MVFNEELEAWTEEDTDYKEFMEDLDKLDTLLKQFRFFEASIKYVTRK
jgi:5'-deoxynucleotidase YfbR-like HD superfamily hydrolase